MYAQRDAQVWRDFLVKEADFPAERCLVLTDLAAAASPFYPNQENIRTAITDLCQQQLEAGDVLWCFFSGYGLQVDGKDYLMPIEADPNDAPNTGIAIESLFALFETAPTQKIILVLDVNRSQHVFTGEGVGDQTALLAQGHHIATILSSLPDQFAHETLALRQGLFTTALIEALRYRGCITLDQLVQYLHDRLPALSEQHWRPRQDPLAVIPAEQKYQLIVPEQAAIHLGAVVGATVGTAELEEGRYGASPQVVSLLERSYATPYQGLPQASGSLPGPTQPREPIEQSTSPSGASLSNPAQSSDLPWKNDPFWRSLLTWGGILAGVLLLGVVLRNAGILMGTKTSSPAQTPATPTSPVSPAPLASPAPSAPIDLPTVIAAAQTAIQTQQYAEAHRQLEQIPAEQQTADSIKLMEQANRGLLSQAKGMLSRAREMTAENQASDFVDAIEVARLIKPNQPLYDDAQQNIDRWSRVILDMAQGRAERGNDGSPPAAAANYNSAIATAFLVPTDRPEIYTRAQQAIAQWSQLIMNLANGSAQAGDLDLAIQTAELIPPNTPIYATAQESIASWRNQPAPVPPIQ